MEIPISQNEQAILSELAVSAGYDDVTLFVTEHVRALAQQHPLMQQPGPQELAENLTRLRQSESSIDAGRGIDLEEGIQSIAEKHGFHLNT